ncbi:MAG: hypothetical protein R2795_01215 [Saprospiraceae bacterium]
MRNQQHHAHAIADFQGRKLFPRIAVFYQQKRDLLTPTDVVFSPLQPLSCEGTYFNRLYAVSDIRRSVPPDGYHRCGVATIPVSAFRTQPLAAEQC